MRGRLAQTAGPVVPRACIEPSRKEQSTAALHFYTGYQFRSSPSETFRIPACTSAFLAGLSAASIIARHIEKKHRKVALMNKHVYNNTSLFLLPKSA
jgi:hypothetical protein